MAGLEIVVRPFVFPDIRPRARQSLPPQDDPTNGFAKIDGQTAQQVSLSYSMSVSSSHSKPREVERRVDVARVYQEEDDGTVNKENFIDIEVANRITTAEPVGRPDEHPRAPGDHLTPWSDVPENLKQTYYKRVDEWEEAQKKQNIEIRERDKILKDKQQRKNSE